jgi:hypothetical protein
LPGDEEVEEFLRPPLVVRIEVMERGVARVRLVDDEGAAVSLLEIPKQETRHFDAYGGHAAA